LEGGHGHTVEGREGGGKERKLHVLTPSRSQAL
jgi:hypothetical protein